MSTIVIKEADIVTIGTDAVVNAANEGLWEGGGVCGAIFAAAGSRKLTLACEKYGRCDTGSAVITPGFNLNSKYIIHAVGPRYKDGSIGEERALYSAYKTSMQLAMDNDCHSIAFPVISSGIFGYPKEEAFRVGIASVAEFQEKHPDYTLDAIFCVRGKEMLTIGTNVLKGEFPAIPGTSTSDPDFTLFWMTGEPNEEFSNWYSAPFTIEGITYNCVEQYMMAKKALVFKDFESYVLIINESDPDKCKKLGRGVRNFDSELWDSCKEDVVYNANYAKFSQNESLKKKLLATGDTIMAEASPYDAVWGIKLAADDPNAKNPGLWQGQNLLGKILMRIRDELKG